MSINTLQNVLFFFKMWKNNFQNSEIKTKTNNDRIPTIFRYLYPQLRFEDYQILKNDASFFNKIVLVCEDCFYQNNAVNYLSGAECISDKKLEIAKKNEQSQKALKFSLENLQVYYIVIQIC